MNITHANYPHVNSYVKAWKKLIELCKEDPNQLVRIDRDYPISAKKAREDFLKALNNRINSRGGLTNRGKKDSDDYFTGMMRDQIALEKWFKERIVIHYFHTKEVKNRFSHLIYSYDD